MRSRLFKTPDEAASALVSAAKASDMKALVNVLGPDGEDIISSGDEVADAATRQKFVAAYDAKHQIAMEGDNKAIMVIGPEDFPLPIPWCRKMECGVSTRLPAARRSLPPHREERAGRNSGFSGLCRCTERIRRERSHRRRREDLCPTHHQPARKKGRALLADIAG